MYSRPILASLDSCHLVILETQDREIQVSIGEVVSGCDRAVELRDFFQAKILNVELGSFILVLRSDRDVFDLCHRNLLFARRIYRFLLNTTGLVPLYSWKPIRRPDRKRVSQ